MSEVRLQKFIADCGVTSRRKAEELIVQGRVKVNGLSVMQLGSKIDPEIDAVVVDGKVCDFAGVQKIYMVMNKPRGYMTTLHDPEGRKTVLDLCREVSERIYPVGRLDYLSEGLLIMTNDGEVGNRIVHPSSNVVKIYEVKVFGAINESLLNRLRKGAVIDDSEVVPKAVRVIQQLPTKTWIEFRLTEGKNREIRKICEAHGITVDKLRRVAIGGLTIDGICPGGYRFLTKKQLFESVGLNKNGEPVKDIELFSSKKSINLKEKKAQRCTPADDQSFVKFRRETYFSSLNSIEQSKKLARKKELAKSFEEKELAHEKRVNKKRRRLKAKQENGKFVHAQVLK